jgi:hypothetical protein
LIWIDEFLSSLLFASGFFVDDTSSQEFLSFETSVFLVSLCKSAKVQLFSFISTFTFHFLSLLDCLLACLCMLSCYLADLFVFWLHFQFDILLF